MRRLATMMGAAAVVVWAASAFAQAPNFAGSWVPDSNKNPAPAGGGRGVSIGITQDAKTISVTPRGQGLPAAYNLDGSDSKNTISLGVDVVSNAKWDGSKLVVTSHTQHCDQVTSYFMDGSDLVIERGGASASQKTYYAKGR